MGLELLIAFLFVGKYVGVYWLSGYRVTGRMSVKQIEISLALIFLFFSTSVLKSTIMQEPIDYLTGYTVTPGILLVFEFLVAIFYTQLRGFAKYFLMGDIKITNPKYKTTYFTAVEKRLFWFVTGCYSVLAFVGYAISI